MQWQSAILLVLCISNGWTEENQTWTTNISTSSVVTEAPVLDQCFYQKASECPNITAGECPCKRMSYGNSRESNAVLCCNLDNNTILEHSFSCSSNTHFCNQTIVKNCNSKL